MATLTGGNGDDLLNGTELADLIDALDGNDTVSAGGGNDTVYGSNGDDGIDGGTGDDSLLGGAGDDVLSGGLGNDRLFAGDGNDYLAGGEGDDTVDGGAGSDLIIYGGGRDEISGGSGFDVAAFNTAVLPVTVDLLQGLAIVGAASMPLAGIEAVYGSSTAANVLRGDDAANVLLGGQADDRLEGRAGNDALTADAGNDTLDGGAGADTLTGGDGDDHYVIDNPGDVVQEWVDEGIDSVFSLVSHILPAAVEHLQLLGTGPLSGTGNLLPNRLVGNDGANILDGGPGSANDTLDGGAGVDTASYASADGPVAVSLLIQGVPQATGGAGSDTLIGIERLRGSLYDDTLTGTAGADVLDGHVGNDTLNGGAGNDTMIGGPGDDTFIVDSAGDVTTEVAGGGNDWVISAVNWGLNGQVENLRLTGSAINGTGTVLANRLEGNAQANYLFGGDGNDTLLGGRGNDNLNGAAGDDVMYGGDGFDTYAVDSPGDVVVELEGEGTDRVASSVSWLLGDHVERLTLTGANAIDGSGNALNNYIIGNAAANRLDGGGGNDSMLGSDGNDTLDGGAGIDTMSGGNGNDTYHVDHPLDITGEGSPDPLQIDTVISSVSRGLGGNLENLVLTGSAHLNGTGNTLANRIEGNAGNNYIFGGSGDDTLIGGEGNDSLEGTTGNDSMLGGAGDDAYGVNAAGDVIVELPGQGIDRVGASISWVLGDHLEGLTLTGAAPISGTGNGLNNTLTGNAAANALAGAAGNDTLSGGDGNDTLTGGAGADRLTGGNGADRFRFVTTGEGPDTITDFAPGTDRILVVAANFGLVTGNAANLVVNGSPTTGAAAFLYSTATGVLSFDADGNGAGAAVQLATLSTRPVISAADLVLGS